MNLEVTDKELREVARLARANGRLEERLEIMKIIDSMSPSSPFGLVQLRLLLKERNNA